MLAIGSNGDAPWKPAARALSSQYRGMCCINPDAPLSALTASGSPLLSHHMTLMNLSSSSLNPYSARAPLTSDLHLSTFSPYGESTSNTVGVGSGVGITAGTKSSTAKTTEGGIGGWSRSRF